MNNMMIVYGLRMVSILLAMVFIFKGISDKQSDDSAYLYDIALFIAAVIIAVVVSVYAKDINNILSLI